MRGLMRITKLGENILREKAEPVAEINDEIRALAAEMFDAMIEADGIGLAGPQAGRKLRIFVVMIDDGVRRVFINPQIISTSKETSEYEEGCLSIPQVYETITRPSKIKVQAFDENGKPFTLEADGLLARVIQHEYDHLNGVLFVDRLEEELKERAIGKFKKLYGKKKQRS